MRHPHDNKASGQAVTREFLDHRQARAQGKPRAKWIQFCLTMLAKGYKVTMYEARHSYSKYITVYNGGRCHKLRFSNHEPIKARELRRDCDTFVGIAHTSTVTTEQAILKVIADLGPAKGQHGEDQMP